MSKPIGSIDIVAYGLCSDSTGHVWMSSYVNSKGVMLEYQHDGTGPIAKLPATTPYGCAVDPSTGNLAVANGSDTITVYSKARGNGKAYGGSSTLNYAYCTYDSNGNLFAQGRPSKSHSSVGISELSKGAKKLKVIMFAQALGDPAGLQWDGSSLVVGFAGATALYRYSIDAYKATLVGQVPLDAGGFELVQFWIEGGHAIATLSTPNQVDGFAAFPYPRGGKARHHHMMGTPAAVTVSAANYE